MSDVRPIRNQILLRNDGSKTSTNKKKNIIVKMAKTFFTLSSIGIVFAVSFIFVFFKTNLLKPYKDMWVQTAMITDNHKYLAQWFLSDEEIQAILDEYEVINNENSNVGEVDLDAYLLTNNTEKDKSDKVEFEKISGEGYTGYVITVSNPKRVKLVDTRKADTGTKLKDLVVEKNAIAAINAGGFLDVNGKGKGNILCSPTIMDGEILYGNKNTRYSYIGFSDEGELILGKYTYYEAIEAGIDDAVSFGPYLIVNGNPQITKQNCGGIHPRTAVGQTKDGKIILVCVDGRKVSSLGCNLEELQQIFIDRGAYNAANLDGGSSSTMYYENTLVNNPSTPAGERYLPNAIIVER